MANGITQKGPPPEVAAAVPSPPSPSPSEGYGFPSNVHDEMCAGAGVVRPHWEYLANALSDLGARELRRRRSEALRQIRDNDVTFNIYDDPRGMGRPWELVFRCSKVRDM